MNILIVDDESFSILAIRKNVNWDRLCGGEVNLYDAYNGEQAREVIKETPIDIMLCDIEMAGESGIDLIQWVRRSHIPMDILIITCHKDFQYAKEAIRLDVYDYCVKPLDFMALEGILRELIEKRKKASEQKEKDQYADYWMKEKESLRTQFWYWFLTEDETDQERIWEKVHRFDISVSDAETFVPVVIAIRKYEVSLVKWDQDKMERSVRNLIHEVMKGTNCEVLLGVKTHIVVISRDGGLMSEKCKELLDLADKLLHVKICCYLGMESGFFELPEKIDALIGCLESDVSHQDGVFIADHMPMERTETELHLPDNMLAKLEKCQFSEFRLMLHMWLKEKCRDQYCSREALIRIRENLQQAFYLHFQKLHISAGRFYESEKMKAVYEESEKLIAALEDWAELVTEYLEKQYAQQLGTQLNERIQKVKEYIDQNMDRELTRQEIAQAVFLNQDYLARSL